MKAAIYSRKSKFTGKGESIENQIQLCKEYAFNQLKDKVIDDFLIYEDEGFSGGNINRPEFQRLMEDAKVKKFDVLICYRLDRISRNVSDFSNTLETLQRYNIDFVSIREQFDTSTPMGRAMIYIASVFAQLERETIAERVKDNMLELSKTGRWLGGTVPIGYESEPIIYYDSEMNERNMVKLKQVPEELQIIKLLYSKYLELKSLSSVETFTLKNNMKTKRGADFTKANIRLVLTNPVYVKASKEVIEYLEEEGITCCGVPDGEHGLLTYNKTKGRPTDNGKVARVSRNKSEWIAAVSSQKGIIEASDWLEVQHILFSNKDRFPNEGKTHNALLTGKLKCAKCGSNMQIAHGHTSTKTGRKIFYYVCAMKKYSKGTRCTNKNAKVDELDLVIKKHLKELSFDKKKFLEKFTQQNKKIKENNNSIDREEAINKSIAEKEKQIANLMNKLSIDNDISDLIINKIKNLKNEVLNLRKELNNIAEEKAKFEGTDFNFPFLGMLLGRCSIIDSLSHEEVKQLIDATIDKITWDGIENTVQIDFIENNKKEEGF